MEGLLSTICQINRLCRCPVLFEIANSNLEMELVLEDNRFERIASRTKGKRIKITGRETRSEFFIANIVIRELLPDLKTLETNEGKKMLN